LALGHDRPSRAVSRLHDLLKHRYAVHCRPGHSTLESTVRYLGVQVEDTFRTPGTDVALTLSSATTPGDVSE
jgi:hypothetical protein